MNPPLLAPWILSTLGLTFSLSSQELDQVLIQVPPAQQSSTLQFSYFLTGPFGGYGAVGELPTTLEHPVAEIRIPIYHNEHRAQSLKAVVYAKGCELARFTLDPLPLGSSRVPFVCRDLPTLRLRGRILTYPEPSTLTVQFTYVATWSHTFFGYLDGATLITLPIADAQPNAGGEFEVQVPDFSKDLATRSYPGLAYWSINARKRGTDQWFLLTSITDPSAPPGHLPITPTYPGIIEFTARPR